MTMQHATMHFVKTSILQALLWYLIEEKQKYAFQNQINSNLHCSNLFTYSLQYLDYMSVHQEGRVLAALDRHK